MVACEWLISTIQNYYNYYKLIQLIDLEGNSVACIWSLSQCEGWGISIRTTFSHNIASLVVIYLRRDLNCETFWSDKGQDSCWFSAVFLSFIALNEKNSFRCCHAIFVSVNICRKFNFYIFHYILQFITSRSDTELR